MQLVLTPELILEAYRQGLFPMAYNSGSPYIHWVCPDLRGQLSITEMHISRSLKKTVRARPFTITIDQAFPAVIEKCAEKASNRPESWINEPIQKVFLELYEQGHAHSVECWADDQLVGGLYGLAIGGAFFGESMFSRARDASKIALVHLASRLWKGGFTLLDTQFVNEHLKQFDVYEVPHDAYKKQLDAATIINADFDLAGISEEDMVQAYFEMRENS